MRIEGSQDAGVAFALTGEASFLDRHEGVRSDMPGTQASAFNPNEVLSRALKEMKGDDRHPGEVVQDRYGGDWNAYLGDIARMYGML